MSEAAQSPLMKEFHADVIREFIEEFPHRKATVERLIREKKITVIEENNHHKVKSNVNKNV